jgi:hypothetical protein
VRVRSGSAGAAACVSPLVEVHEDDLREIAVRGYEGAASMDRTLQAEAVTLFLTDTLVGG